MESFLWQRTPSLFETRSYIASREKGTHHMYVLEREMFRVALEERDAEIGCLRQLLAVAMRKIWRDHRRLNQLDLYLGPENRN